MGMQWRWMLAWIVGAGLAAVLGLVWWWRGLADAANVATVLGAAGLAGALLAWARNRSPGRGRSSALQLVEATEVLVRLVRRQWEDEATLRQLFDPAPL